MGTKNTKIVANSLVTSNEFKNFVNPVAYFNNSKSTGATGIQWHPSWTLKDTQAIFFNTVGYTDGLLIALADNMTDTSGGYLIHISDPTISDANQHVSGLGPLTNASQLTVRHIAPGTFFSGHIDRFWIVFQGTSLIVGKNEPVEDNIIFTDMFLPIYDLRFFGFGTNTGSGHLRAVDNIQIVVSPSEQMVAGKVYY